jgi:hypothetical protein
MLVTYIEKYSKKVLMEPISTSSGTSSKEDIEASVNKYIPHKVCKGKDKLPWITQELKSLIQRQSIQKEKEIKPSTRPSMVLKELASEILPILSIIYNVSIKVGEIPDDWRSAVITPAFKKGQKYVPANYRPISLTCICCKVIEHIVTRTY